MLRHFFDSKSSILTVVLGMLAVTGCGSSGEAGEAEESSGGESASYEGPIGSTDAEGGKEKFDTFCGDCHPDGGEDVGPSLVAEAHSPAEMRQQIREGSGRMRPFSEKRLSGEDMESILAYLATINAVK